MKLYKTRQQNSKLLVILVDIGSIIAHYIYSKWKIPAPKPHKMTDRKLQSNLVCPEILKVPIHGA